jgi:hypothetical protein
MTLAHEPLVALPAPLDGREVRHLTLVRSTPVFEQGALPLTYPLPSGLDAALPGDCVDSTTARRPGAIPDPQPWAARYVQAVIEVLARQRPLSQLARWTAADVYRELSRLRETPPVGTRADARPPRRAVASVRVSSLAPDVAEVAARVAEGARSTAIAARLDYRRDRWTCTALILG